MFRSILMVVICLGVSTLAYATELQVGDSFPKLSLPDQHGQETMVSKQTQIIVFAADRDASDLLNGYLKNQADDLLSANQAEYIADISSMPGLITRLVALPRMRERPYRILLAKDSESVGFIPREDAAVTVIRLQDAQVKDISHVSTETELSNTF